jgi:hypothetical protein
MTAPVPEIMDPLVCITGYAAIVVMKFKDESKRPSKHFMWKYFTAVMVWHYNCCYLTPTALEHCRLIVNVIPNKQLNQNCDRVNMST